MDTPHMMGPSRGPVFAPDPGPSLARREHVEPRWERVSGGSPTFTFAVRSSATAEVLGGGLSARGAWPHPHCLLGHLFHLKLTLAEPSCDPEDLPDASFAGFFLS